uniref:DUF502 domain-containing protein n=1 Tax=Magnetococcus massalia (strain MO-1) TaxID=451514 RepID=A0A1S7LD87_MAGMO|nr:conserved protein of unknown function [Candidatus Magnetococcus massalia]
MDHSPDQARLERSTVWKRLRVRLRRSFITGLLVVLPLGVTLFVIHLLVRTADQLLGYLPEPWQPVNWLPFPLPGLGVLLSLLLILLAGMAVRHWLGEWFVQRSELLLSAIPLVRNLHVAVKQFVETLLGRRSRSFRNVVLLEYPRRGLYAIGFVTSSGAGEVQAKLDHPVYHIFLPTTPNPTSGVLLFVPQDEVIALDMSVEEGLKLVISGGLVVPPWAQPVEEGAEGASPLRVEKEREGSV